jgi:hypothetical protein
LSGSKWAFTSRAFTFTRAWKLMSTKILKEKCGRRKMTGRKKKPRR